MPGEVAVAAKHMGMSEQEFFDKYVAVDYWVDTEEPIFLLAPATEKCSPGSEYPYDCMGTCTFFQEGLCQIHEAKPHECRWAHHSRTNEEAAGEHRRIAEAWKNHQEEVERLLGRKPEMPVPSLSLLLSLMQVFGSEKSYDRVG
jgi:hypothetical protein